MKILEKVNWGYILFETEEGIFLSVVCGTVGLFETVIRLTDEEVQSYNSIPDFIKNLADKVCSNPHVYKSRHITKKFDFPKS
jgi:hypothetical protein